MATWFTNHMTTNYAVRPAPKFAQFHEFDCQVCGCETLLHPVFLDGPTGQVIAGTGCAARLLDIDAATVGRLEASASLSNFTGRMEAAYKRVLCFKPERVTAKAITSLANDCFITVDEASEVFRVYKALK